MAEKYISGYGSGVNSSGNASPSSSSDLYGWQVVVNFYQEVIEPGKTRITWKVIPAKWSDKGKVSYASAGAYLTLTAVKGSLSNITGTSISTSRSYYDSSVLGTGSCILTHNNSGEGSFKVSIEYSVGGWPSVNSGTITADQNVPYTACGAPTTVSASGIIKTDGSFTISWSGATNGVSNKIKAYQVYWYATSNGTAPTASVYSGTQQVDVTDGTTSGSYTVKLNSATRGYKVVCGVKALSELNNSTYDSDIKTGGLVTINSLPGVPSVSVNKTIVPSTNGQVTFTMTAGSDVDSGQTLTLYYATSASGSKTKVTSPWSPTVTATTTYYFWTYDDLEYSSSSTAVTITKNTKPTFTVGISSQSLTSSNNNSGYNYTIAPTITVSGISGGQSDKKYIYKLHYGADASTTSSKTLYNLVEETSKTIADIRSEGIDHETNGAYYRVSVQCYDGIEYSDVKYSDIRYVTKIPSLVGIYNKTDFSNVSGFHSGEKATHFSKFLGFKFTKDAGYNTLKFKNYDDITKTITLSVGTDYTQGSWTNSETPSSSKYYNLSYQIGYSSGYFYSAITQNITKIGYVSLSNFKFGRNTFSYFTDAGVYANTVGHSYSASPLTEGALKDYGIATKLTSSHLLGQIFTNSKQSSDLNLEPNANSTNNNTIGFNISSETLTNAVKGLFTIAQKNTYYNSTFRLFVMNDFGDLVQTDASFVIDFRSNTAMELTLKGIYPKAGETINENSIDNWDYLKESMKLIGNFKITSYNTNPKGEVQIQRSTETNWQSLTTFSFTTAGTEATPGSPLTYEASNIAIQTIGEISNPNYAVKYRLIVKSDGGDKTFSLYENIPVRGHTQAALFIKNTNYNPDGTGKITVDYEVTNWGALTENLILGQEGNKRVLLYEGNQESAIQYYTYESSQTFFSNKQKSTEFVYKIAEDTESILVKVCFYTELGTYLKSDKEKSTIYFKTQKITDLSKISLFPVFNILPTIAYRKNHLGINVLNPSNSSDAIIVIGEISGRDAIYFQPASENSYCKVINFHIDCGDAW